MVNLVFSAILNPIGDFLRVMCFIMGVLVVASLTEAIISCIRSGWRQCRVSLFNNLAMITFIGISLFRTSATFDSPVDGFLFARTAGLAFALAAIIMTRKNLKQFLYWSKFPDSE